MQGRLVTGMVCVVTMLGGCFGSGGGGNDNRNGNGLHGNLPPVISGSPQTAMLRKETYVFQPSASDPDGDRLRFSIQQKPPWAQFDEKTGTLSGTPKTDDVGEYIAITISVSDGRHRVSLPSFSIAVYHSGDESATLSWMPPTEYADGSVLKDLDGYYIYVGQSEDALHRVIGIRNEGLTRYVVEELYPATWYFAMTAYDKEGIESRRSPVVSTTIG